MLYTITIKDWANSTNKSPSNVPASSVSFQLSCQSHFMFSCTLLLQISQMSTFPPVRPLDEWLERHLASTMKRIYAMRHHLQPNQTASWHMYSHCTNSSWSSHSPNSTLWLVCSPAFWSWIWWTSLCRLREQCRPVQKGSRVSTDEPDFNYLNLRIGVQFPRGIFLLWKMDLYKEDAPRELDPNSGI